MNIPILSTKLYIPWTRTKIVDRIRLIERLNDGLDRKLTLISVSAGFGKTTLVSAWAAACGRPVAWLSLDEGDRDSIRFLNHLIAALQTVEEDIGGGAVRALNSPQSPSIESIITMLLNDISALPHKFVLVLDDYHVIGEKWADNALGFLLEQLPQQLHLVIVTREDPQLPLSRLRARGQLNELRAADLRFSSDEAADFLNQMMGLSLTVEDIAALDARTEGWITGLQLAALSMHGRKDIAAFLQAFAGDHRYIVDYLVEEVLQRQSEEVRSFLLQTSILERLHGPLCDAVTGQEDGSARLHALERGNFFVVPLDDKRQWYRYHHLFAEVLSAQLQADQLDQAAILHRRASLWYEQQGLFSDAIRHALSAGDFVRAADLVELSIPAMRMSRQESAVLRWLKAIPDFVIQCRPVLSVGYAGMLLSNGELEKVDRRLRDAERWLENAAIEQERSETPSAEMVVVDIEEFRRLPAAIAMYRAGMSLVLGDIPNSLKYARRVLELVPEGDLLAKGAAISLLGLSAWRTGNLQEAHQMFAEGIGIVQQTGAIPDAINGSIALAEIRIAQGRLRQAMRAYERGLQLALEQGEPEMRGTADLLVGMSELYLECNDLHAAMDLLQRSKDQGEHAGFMQNRYRSRVAMARIMAAQGNLDQSLDLLSEADQLFVNDFFPNVRPIPALKARIWALQGKVGEALEWAREQGVFVDDELQYLREFEHITLARVLLARYKSNPTDASMMEATGLLQRLLLAAEEGERTGSTIEILILQAIARFMKGDGSAALVPLERALTLAEPEGYVRIFVDEGKPMAILLETFKKRGIALNYVRLLLEVFKSEGDQSTAKSQQLHHRASEQQTKRFTEPLSEREREVLRLLASDLSGPEIAGELVVSLNTLRTHTKNIYDKLEVNNRRSAVSRAKELDLI